MDNFIINGFYAYQQIGKGSFGMVYKGIKNGTLYAIKRLKKGQNAENNLKNEIGILKVLKHRNIINFVEAITSTNHHYIITEFCNGGTLTQCLIKYIQINKRAFPEGIVQHLMRQIVDAIKYLHQKGIIHRDIKLDNILVHFENEYDRTNLNMLKATIKLIDFGESNYLGPSNERHTIRGTIPNMDPIIVENHYKFKHCQIWALSYNEKADIYSMGTACYEMLVGRQVFEYKKNLDLFEKLIEEGNYHVPINLSKESISFLNGMLQYDYTKRQSADVLSKHPFLTKNFIDFQPMDFTQIYYKLDSQGLKINIKLNQTITAIFQGDYQIPLINININIPENFNNEKPLPELDEFVQKTDNNIIYDNNIINNYPNNFINNNVLNNRAHNNAINEKINNQANNNKFVNKEANAKPDNLNKKKYFVNQDSKKNVNKGINHHFIRQQAYPHINPNLYNNANQFQQNNQLLFNQVHLVNPQYQQAPQLQANVGYAQNIQYTPINVNYVNNAQLNNMGQNQVIQNECYFHSPPPQVNIVNEKQAEINPNKQPFLYPAINNNNTPVQKKGNLPQPQYPPRPHAGRVQPIQKQRNFSKSPLNSKIRLNQKSNNNINEYIKKAEKRNNYYDQQKNYINDNRQNFHKENPVYARCVEGNNQKTGNHMGKNQNKSCPKKMFCFNKEKANIQNNNYFKNEKLMNEGAAFANCINNNNYNIYGGAKGYAAETPRFANLADFY